MESFTEEVIEIIRNIPAGKVTSYGRIAAMAGKKSIYAPIWLTKKIMKILWTIHLLVEAPPGIMNYIMYQWVVDTTRAKKELAWKPKYNTRETLKIMLNIVLNRLIFGRL